MKRQTLIAITLFQSYFFIMVFTGSIDQTMLLGNLVFTGWLGMEAMRVRLGHAEGESRTFGILSRSFLIVSFTSVAVAFADRSGNFVLLATLPDTALFIGFILLAIGVWLRHLSIKTLGRFFVTKVQIRHDHNLVKDGIYSLLRHPSYTGLILGFLGVILILQSTTALVLFITLGIPAYSYRIWIEEKSLIKVFGDEYRSYRTETYALIPFVY
jgi:protein-S-isoprenylcysteine O-methyltransferase Ste14